MKIIQQKITIIAAGLLIFTSPALAKDSALVTAVKGHLVEVNTARSFSSLPTADIESVKKALENKDVTENDVQAALTQSINLQAYIKRMVDTLNRDRINTEPHAAELRNREAITLLLNAWLDNTRVRSWLDATLMSAVEQVDLVKVKTALANPLLAVAEVLQAKNRVMELHAIADANKREAAKPKVEQINQELQKWLDAHKEVKK